MHQFYKHLLLMALFLFVIQTNAQQNIAPQATVTASTCNTGACATLNDLNFGTCQTQIMWITTATPPDLTIGVNWIQWDWTSAKTVNAFMIHHGQTATRFLNGGTIQSWNGSAWVTISTFLNLTPACSSLVSFPTTTTARLRITSFRMSGTQLSNPNFREIEVFGPTVNNDAAVTLINQPNTCTYKQKLTATITNLGKKRLDSFRLNWSANAVARPTRYITSNLLTGQSMNIDLDTAFVFQPASNNVILASTSTPNGTVDSLPANDQFNLSFYFMGSPDDPTVTNFVQCGRGVPRLSAVTTNPADSVFWYDQASGGNLLGLGKNIPGPYTISTRTFYAEAAKLGNNIRFGTTGTTGVNVRQTEPYGGMQTITNNKQILMDSIQFRLWYATPVNCGYQLYYKTGTHVGFTTNPAPWIKLSEGVITYITIGGLNYGRVNANKLNLPPGTYSFYLTTDLDFGAGNSLYSVLNGAGANNADISIATGGNIIIGKFGSTQVLTYQPELTYIYKNQCVSVNRVPLTVTVKPRPLGADVVKSTPFQGQFRLGVSNDPDVIEVGKTISYELNPPSAYSNSDHGLTWIINGVTAYTQYNVLVPSTEYTVIPPAGNNRAHLSFKPKSAWLDSLITFTVKFTDLGPYFCDSSVKRTIYVAPTPKPNFTFPTSICLGESTLFENLTSIHSGVCSYQWYFGDNDSSDLNSPVHEYKNAGTYNVRLVARSIKWLIAKDTTITVNIGEVPEVDFKVKNACFGSAINLSNITFIGNGTLSYQWNFGDGSPVITTTNASKMYAAPGAYKVTLSAEANGCTAVKSKVVYQFAKPVANFIKQTGNCLNEEYSFTNLSTISIGQFGNKWDFNDGGSIASDKNTTYTFKTAGTKNVKLVVISEFGCTDSVVNATQVKQIPTTNFTYPFACDRSSTPFTNTSMLNGETLAGYLWNFGNNVTSTAFSPTYKWPAVGKQTVTLKTTLQNGCSSQISKEINVGVQPLADFEFQNKCSGEPVTFTNLSTYSNGKVEYEWDFGDNNSSTTPTPIHEYNPGATHQSFFVKLKASIVGGCADSITKVITIAPLPSTCDFDVSRNWSVNSKNVLLTPKTGSSTGISYTWIMGDGNQITSTNGGSNYTYQGHLKYCITMVAKNSSDCECTATKCIDVNTALDQATINKSIQLYPNPSSGVFTVSSDLAVENMQITVYSVNGETLYSTSITGTEGLIDISHFASGIYYVKIETANGSSMQFITLNR